VADLDQTFKRLFMVLVKSLYFKVYEDLLIGSPYITFVQTYTAVLSVPRRKTAPERQAVVSDIICVTVQQGNTK
jgi:hypothetical protein